MAKAKILIVEDEAVVAADLADKLERAGYGVVGIAARGEQAIGQAATGQPDLVLMDIRLAGRLDGIDTAKQILAARNVPVVYLTAHSDSHTLERAYGTEPFGYILKPFEERDLTTQIEIALYKHRSERRVRESELRYRTLVEGALDTILTLDDQGLLLSSNAAAEDMFGYGCEEMLGRHVGLFMPTYSPDWHEHDASGPKGSTRPGLRGIRELDARRKDGTWFPVEVSVSKTVIDGQTVLTCILRDVTERKRSEGEIRWRANLLEQTHEAVIVRRLGGGIVYWNRGATELYGWTAEEVLGRSPHDLLHSALPAAEKEFDRRLVEAGQWYGEIHQRTKDGGSVIVESRMAPMPESADGMLVMETNRDVTERHAIHQKVCRLAEELEDRVRQRTGDLLHSQELLRQLASELTLAEQRERRRLATDLHDYLAQLLICIRLKVSQARVRQSQAEPESWLREAEEVLQQALDYTRSMVAQLAPMMLHEFGLSASLTWLGEQMQRQDLTVSVDVGGHPSLDLPEEQAILLFQSVRELLINVAKHARAERASVRLSQADGTLRIEVQDEGVGFDDPAASAPITDTPVAAKFGLFSIRERMHALGGSFDIESSRGKGTTARLVLPLRQGTTSDAVPVLSEGTSDQVSGFRERRTTGPSPITQPATRPHRSRATDHQRREPHAIRVLLVDDHAMVREGLRTMLEGHADVEVVGEAGNGVEGVATAEALRPDVVVMDINMPKMDGIEATSRIKTRLPATIVIGLSMHNSGHYEESIRQAGASGYLSKESVAEHLYELIRTCWAGSDGPYRETGDPVAGRAHGEVSL